MNREELVSKVKETVENDPNKDYIQSISLFGSFLRGDNKPGSDVDLLYEMRKTMSLFKIASFHHHLEQNLGRKVDFVDRDSVIPQLRDEIILSADKIYERE